MKIVNKYESTDGLTFESAESCMKHEEGLFACAKIMIDLPERPDDINFSNGEGYVQHDIELALTVRNELLSLAKTHYDHRAFDEVKEYGLEARGSIVGRLIDDACPSCIKDAWYRFMCIDNNGREWGQPYYASKPPLDQKQLN